MYFGKNKEGLVFTLSCLKLQIFLQKIEKGRRFEEEKFKLRAINQSQFTLL
jgi:hypothetical protein